MLFPIMKNYKDFGHMPDYGYELRNSVQLIDSARKVNDAYCFSKVFRFLITRDEIYTGIYTLRCRKKFIARSGNYCSLTKNQILTVLRYMRRLFNIKTMLRDTEDNYIITLKVSGLPVKHKVVLTFSRVFFEYPFNEFASEVFRFRNAENISGISFKRKSFISIYHLISTTCCGNGGIHSLFCFDKQILTKEYITKALNDAKNTRVYDVFHGVDKSVTHKSIKNWDTGFNERTPLYIDNLKKLR